MEKKTTLEGGSTVPGHKRWIPVWQAIKSGQHRYLVAVVIAVAAFTVRWAFLQDLGIRDPYETFYPAVMLAALYGGLRAGLLATLLSSVLAGYFWIEPVASFSITSRADGLALAIFILSCTMISWITEVMHRVRARASTAEQEARRALELKRTARALRQSEALLRAVCETTPDPIFVKDHESRLLMANPATLRAFGKPLEEVIGKRDDELYSDSEIAQRLVENDRRVIESGVAGVFEETIQTPEGRQVFLSTKAPYRDADGCIVGLIGVARDITERTQAEEERESMVEFLHMVSSSAGSEELIRVAAPFFQTRSGCEAVGVRLKEGEDYPYYEARGFQPEFVLAENSLCARDGDGEILRDGAGEPMYECMCGNVICGRFDPSKPFFTAKGTFWTNSTSELLATTTAADRQARTRNRCNREGYESVALFPLRVGGQCLGLLQFNGRRKGSFSPESIARWERVSEYLAVALAKFKADEALQKAHANLETHVQERTEALRRANRDMLVLNECDEALLRATTEAELLNQICNIVVKIDQVQMAWIGFAEQDEAKSVRPVTQLGGDKEYLKKVHVSWADTPNGRGPTGTAIRTQKVVQCREVATDPCFTPWREDAMQREYRSVVALPLLWEEQCLGALSIYSSHAGGFPKEEMELLERLVNDLVYGIIALRTRAERSQLQRELLKISEREKQLIAQELHDGLCQNLAGTAMMASVLHRRLAEREDPDAEYAKQISAMLSTNVHETRNLSHGLHPVGPEGEGLMNALGQLAETVSNLFHIRCFFRCPEPVLLENEIASTHLYRISQEAINNSRKHGEASRILISLQNTVDGITLTIRDNGVGIPQKIAKKNGLGIKGMDYRAAEIGAILTVHSTGKKGTVVTCIYRPDSAEEKPQPSSN